MTQITRDTSKGQLVALGFGQTDLAASQTDVQVTSYLGEAAQTNDGYTLPWDFDIVGISYQLTAAVTAGAGGIGATINGTEDADTTLAFLADSTTVKGYKRVARGACPGVAGDVVGLELTTNGTFAPITTDLNAIVWVIAYLEAI
jgi:hypothetical protein